MTLQAPDTNATLYYTLDGTLPATDSFLYSAPFQLTNSATVNANAFETNFNNSVAASAVFTLPPSLSVTLGSFLTNHQFQLRVAGMTGNTYVLEGGTNLINWVPLSTTVAPADGFNLYDTNAGNYPYRFYRVIQP